MDKKPVTISKYSMAKLNKLDLESILLKRKQNASYLNEHLAEFEMFKYREFNNNFSLTGFPIILDNRKQIISSLKKDSIKPLVYNKLWWFVPVEKARGFKQEFGFLNSHLLLPIHENLKKNDLNRIINSIKNSLK